MGDDHLLMSCGLLLVFAISAIAKPYNTTIHIGYFMTEDPYRAAAVNLAINKARDDGMLSRYNFRYIFSLLYTASTVQDRCPDLPVSKRPGTAVLDR